MNAHEFGAGYGLLLAAYADQLKDMSEDERKQRRNLYVKMLSGMDSHLWQEVCGVAIQSSKWFPKVSELIGYAQELSRVSGGDRALDAGAAFTIALRLVRRLDPLSHKPMSPVRDDVEAVVHSLGGWSRLALVENDELGWYRKEFIAAWTERYGLVGRLSPVRGGLQAALAEGDQGAGRAPLTLGTGQPDAAEWEGVLDDAARSIERVSSDQGTTREGG
jgi:hypothetical protein